MNCSACSEDLLEAELFGCKKGAFTGATENRKGKLLQAHRGTLFLDEIGAMSLGMQTKLLKAVEERTFYPVGSDEPERSEFRLVSATLEDLQRLITQGKLRFDFFQRIHGLTVTLKPLADRKRDILPLIAFFTRGGKRLSFSNDAKACLQKHPWPGNTRELRKFVELVAAGTDGRVTLEQTRRYLDQAVSGPPGAMSTFVPEHQYRYALEHGLDGAIDRIVGEIIRRNLAENGGTKAKTLSDLKIANRLLYSTLRKLEAGDDVPA
ncbi:MAG: sigma-54-dependent Fis family transcriptional regulator [Elusimicrobia bacterium]|nr:sigma-54-dependent Fis family transcriptional regulator [Elusimicrobiota bacterium]